MPYSAKAVANFFIDVDKVGGITPMKIQKLVYFSHGWNLAITGNPLISEPVQAWRFGPVIPSLYRECKEFGSEPIKEKLCDIEMQGTLIKWVAPTVTEEKDLALLQRVWSIYGKYTAIQLSNMTHQEGSPWRQVIAQFPNGNLPKGVTIPNDLIKTYFSNLASMSQKG